MEIDYGALIYRTNCRASDLDAIYHQAAQKLGVSDSVMFVLYLVYENNGKCLLKAIQKETNISKQTLNSSIRKLESDGIIYLEQIGGRAKMVCFTEKGTDYANHTIARLFHAECAAFEGWTVEELTQYVSLMERYNRSFREQIEKM